MSKETQLVKVLLQRTIEGSISWELTASEDEFQTAFPNHTIRISRVESYEADGDISYGYVLRLLNQDSKVIEELYPGSLDSEVLGTGGYSALSQIFDQARRQAMGVDKALDEILQELDKTVPF